MEQNIADFLKSAFPETDFEQVHFDDDFKTTHSDGTPQRQTAMVDNHNYRDTSEPLAMSALDFPQIPSSTNANEEEEIKNCSENNEDCLLDEQSMKMASMVYNSWDDNNSIENKTQVQQQQMNVCDEESRESEFKMHAETSDLHQMENKQDQTEDVSLLELVPTKGTHHDLGAEYHMVMEKTTSDLMSCQMLDKLKNRVDPEHVFQYAMNDNNFSAIESELHDCPIVSTEDESEDEIQIFTEDDHVKKGLADYPSDLSESVNEGNSESHSIPTDISKQSETLVVHEIENLATTTTHDDIQKESRMDPQDMATLKNEELAVEAISSKYDFKHDYDHVCVNYKLSNDSLETEIYNKRVSDCSDFRNYENFQTIAKMETYSEKYINEHPDYDSDISSHGDYNKSHGEEGDPISHTCKEVKNLDLPEQKHSFTKDLTRDWKSTECDEVDIEDTDHQSPGICDVVGLSGITTSSGAEMEDSRMEDCWTNSSENPNSSSVSVLNPSEYISVKLNRNNKEHNSGPLEVLDIGENINSLLPETFWSLMAEDNLKLDEYDWDINEEEVTCDREDYFLEELENDGLETERDWEKEKARIEAFNRYYGSVEGEINEATTGRIHKVKFCLDPESCQYGEDSDGSEEEVSSVSEWNSPQYSSVRPEQSSNEHNHEPLEVSDIRENISTLEPKTVWSSSLLMDEDNLKLEKYGDDINGDDFHKINSTMEICDEKEKLLEELKNVGQERMDWEQEPDRIEAFKRYYEEPVGGGQNKVAVRSHKVTLSLDQESSQYEEVDDDDDDDDDDDSSEQESNTEDEITFKNLKTEDQSESDEPKERYSCRLKVLPKGLQKPGQKLKEQHKSYRCLVLLKSALAASLVTVVGVLSYWWATDSLDWIY
ncbi:protein PFC0760c-like isoform X2 [Xyrauchen texanus]|uniref:protein PFC0760c-like isoform X2 n=1 Tax=Xyrauchen texanus TaxID=154827 RepID=UPI002241CC54|nr:protein PFC0760c-like isoform X2 [Xyrauchen texanus]